MEKGEEKYVYAVDGSGGRAYPERNMVIVGYLLVPWSSCMEYAYIVGSMIDYFLSWW